MCQGAVERALGKLLTDDTFRERFFADPAGASFNAGLELSGAELDALTRLPKQAVARFSRLLDDRICWLPFDEEQHPEPGEALPVEGDRPRADAWTECATAPEGGAEAEGWGADGIPECP